MAGNHFDWTEERIMTAHKLRKQGYSAAAIGERFGVSRSSVLGMMKRVSDAEVAAGGKVT